MMLLLVANPRPLFPFVVHFVAPPYTPTHQREAKQPSSSKEQAVKEELSRVRDVALQGIGASV